VGIQDIVALSVVAGACFYVARTIWRQMSSGSCGCDASCNKNEAAARAGIKRTPLVTLGKQETPKNPADPPVASPKTRDKSAP